MSLIIELKVIPGAKHNKIVLDKSDKLVFYIKSIAQDNKANDELMDILRVKLKIPKSNISIISGHTTRFKRILLDGDDLTIDIVLKKLGLEKSESNMRIW